MMTRIPKIAPTHRRTVVAGFLTAGAAAAAASTSSLFARQARAGDLWKGITPDAHWNNFEMVVGDTLLVRAHIGNTPVEAILDSGSAASIISASLASRLGLEGSEKRTIRGISGRASAGLAHNIDLMIGRQASHLDAAFIVDLETASAAFGRPIDLVLGQDVFAGRCLALDFATSRYTLSEGFAGGPDWTPTPLGHGANRELIAYASVAGLPPAPLVIDLGSATALMLARGYVDRHGLLDGKRRSTAMLGGVEGSRIATAFVADRVDLAGLGIDTIPALAVDPWLSVSTVGNIGLPLLAQFNLVLDFTVGRMWLHALPVDRRPPMLKDLSGFDLAASADALTIVHLSEGSPAARGGWAVGERIVAIDGKPIGTGYTRSSLWRWRYGPAGRRVKLTIEGGEVREIQLAAYY
mgnify:CR=1 FL=1